MLGATDLHAAMASLAKRRPVFHSEADFQFALAWELRRRHPDVELRLEYPVPLKDVRGEVDIWLPEAGGAVAIELKYWTRRAELTANDEPFLLKERAFKNLYLYDFWKDVARTESLIAQGLAQGGYVIALTNDRFYESSGKGTAAYEAFRMYEGREVPSGTLAWTGNPSRNAIRGREEPHRLRGRYFTSWQPYPSDPADPGSNFRYLLLDVEAGIAEAKA
ncbi:MAG: hypothetical protein F4X03_04415 [Dehalococcoidia bacterium]|nr:hypothetical protein [Dehalococcoidia bacterium]